MYLIGLFLPLLSFLSLSLFGRFLGGKGASQISIICLFTCCFLSFLGLFEVGLAGSFSYTKLFPWLSLDLIEINWSFCFDTVTAVMFVVVTFISSLVHLYSTEYMGEDPHLPRFMSYLSLFTFFMLILITSDNFVQMFVGWEGVGLCSYLLINFWFTRLQANKSAIKAMLVNRVGDFGLILGLFCIFKCFGTLDYATTFALAPQAENLNLPLFFSNYGMLNFIGVFLFVGAVGKSAQLGLHTWLPDAMEGPTPVSALIHAATMVTVGVFLLVRCSPLLEFCPKVLEFVTLIGAMTAFFASTTAIVQNDLKRVIAYSTCSQLGYMIFACGLSNYSVAIFHLANHAFFKALLFLGAGSIIHSLSDEQDLRKMGGLKRLLPYTYSVMVVGSFSLMGMPFLSGFFSKDVILEVAYGSYSIVGHFAYWLGSLAAFCTAFYSIRLIALCFLSEPNGDRKTLLSASEGGYPIIFSLAVLSVPSIYSGDWGADSFIGVGSFFWGSSIFVLPANLNFIDAEFMSTSAKLLPLVLSITGAILSFNFYTKYKNFLVQLKTNNKVGKNLYNFLNRKWFFDKTYNETLGQTSLRVSHDFTYKTIDRGAINQVGPQGIQEVASTNASFVTSWQSGMLYHYSSVLVLSIVFISIASFVHNQISVLVFPLFAICMVMWSKEKKPESI